MLNLDNTDWALFEGMEQEGPNRGLSTLFVKGLAPLDSIMSSMVQKHYSQVYFGAGFLSTIHWQAIDHLVQSSWHSQLITFETPANVTPLFEKYSAARPHKVFWMLPVVWNGMLNSDGISTMHGALTLPWVLKQNVLVKVDTGHSTFVSRLRDIDVSYYKDYRGDRLLCSKESK